MSRPTRTPGPIALAALLALSAAPLRATLPVALAAPAPLAGPGPGVMAWQPSGGLGQISPETDVLARFQTADDDRVPLVQVDLGPEPEPEWAPPRSFAVAYPGSKCYSMVLEEKLDKLAREYRDLEPGQPLTDLEAFWLSENMGEPTVVEERVDAIKALIHRLEDYLCQVHKAWSHSSAPDRERVLYRRLVAAKGLRQNLGVSLRDAQKVVKACWKRLNREPERWKEPEDEVITPEWRYGVPDPLRVTLLQNAAVDLAAARERFDSLILPLLQDLKRNGKAPVLRDREERIEAAPEAQRESGRAGKRRK